jgi:indolepyruvate ferredoxin oxidoreductase
VGADSLETAIQMNGVAVERNLQAFRYGRLFEHDPGALKSLLGEPERSYHEERERYLARLGRYRRAYVELLGRAGGLDERLRRMLAIRLGELIQYQDVDYASGYLERVLAVNRRERAVAPGRDDLTEAAIRNLYKLMAYKDEYEVARLLLKGEWAERLRRTFVDPKVRFNLHPPFLRERGLARKLELGGWFRPFLAMLVPLRRLRGGPLDPFGRSEVRRTERELVAWYESLLEEIGSELSPANYQTALQIAGAPDRIRGYEQIKLRSAQATRDYVERKRTELREVPASA